MNHQLILALFLALAFGSAVTGLPMSDELKEQQEENTPIDFDALFNRLVEQQAAASGTANFFAGN